MADPTSFFFANAEPGSPLSYEALQTRRKIAEQLMGKRSPFPKTFGEGLTYAGERIADVMNMNRLDAAEREREAGLTAIERGAPPSGAAARSAENTVVAPSAGRADAGTDMAAPVQTAAAPYSAPGAAPGNIPLPPPRPARLRDTQLAELQADPALLRRAAAMTLGEVDKGTSPAERQTQFASALDRAGARGIPVAQALETYTGPGSRGYYPPDAFARGERLLQKPGAMEAFERDIATPVLRGADPGAAALGFTPTGNASGGVAQRGVASGRYNVAGQFPGSAETYVQQETPGQLARLEAGRNRIAAAASQPVQTAALTTPGVASDAPAASAVEAVAALPTQQSPPARTPPLIPGSGPPIPSSIPLAPADVRTPGVQTAQAIPALPANMPPGYEMPRPEPPPVPQERPKNERELYGERILAQGIRRGDPQMQAMGQDYINREKAVRDHLYARDVEAYKNQYGHFSALDKLWQETQIAKQGKTLELNRSAYETVFKPQQLQQGLTKEDIANRAAALKLEQETPTPVVPAMPPGHPDLGTNKSDQRTGTPLPAPQPPGTTGEAWRKIQEPLQAQALKDVDSITPEAHDALKIIREARDHPGRKFGIGLTATQAARIGGTDAIGFAQINDQLRSKSFLAGIQKVKGSGLAPISNAEGAKIEGAQARLNAAQSKEDYDKGLNNLEITLREALERAQRKVRQPVTAWQLKPDDPYAPDVGQHVTRKGYDGVWEYREGNPALSQSYRRIQ